MNLWRRGSRFTFQKRVPSDLVPVLGATPIRVVLPRCGCRQADRLAVLLGGAAEAIFQQLRLGMRDTEEDPRDAVIREFQEYASSPGRDRGATQHLLLPRAPKS